MTDMLIGIEVNDLQNIKIRPCSSRSLRHATRTFVVSAVILTSFVTSPEAAEDKESANATQVLVDAVRKSPFTQTIPVIGRFVARQLGDVATRVSGAVDEIMIDVGDRVKKGDVIATLVDDRLEWQRNLQRAEVSNSNARVQTNKARITLLRKEYDRVASLKKSPAFSQARLDDKQQEILVAESELSEAMASLRKAQANLKLTEIDFQDAKIHAPFSGVVSQKFTAAGSYLNVGQKIVTLIDDTTLEIEADVPSSRVSALQPDTRVAASFRQGGRVHANVRAIVPEENPQTRTRAVRFVPDLPDGQAGLAANQSITLYIPYGKKQDVLSVHKDAVLNRRGMRLVVVPEDGKATFRPVVLGDAVDNRFVVIKGLKEGEKVVIRGNERLRPKQSIKYEGQPAPKAPAKSEG